MNNIIPFVAGGVYGLNKGRTEYDPLILYKTLGMSVLYGSSALHWGIKKDLGLIEPIRMTPRTIPIIFVATTIANGIMFYTGSLIGKMYHQPVSYSGNLTGNKCKV